MYVIKVLYSKYVCIFSIKIIKYQNFRTKKLVSIFSFITISNTSHKKDVLLKKNLKTSLRLKLKKITCVKQ